MLVYLASIYLASVYNGMHSAIWREKMSMSYQVGRHFQQIPGPSKFPDWILLAINRAVIDHRGPEFAKF